MRLFVSASLCMALLSVSAHAQEKMSLKQAFEAAWARQPEARAAALRRSAGEATRASADSWLAAAPSLSVSGKSDQLNHNDGLREYEAGVALPLWLPGERSSAQALADAQSTALNSHLQAAQLRLAANLRDAWWEAARAAVDVEVAQARLKYAQQLAADVMRRVKAGDLARADQHQADGAVAAAQAALAETQSAQAVSRQQLNRLLGAAASGLSTLPESTAAAALDETQHPALREIADRAESARRAKALAGTQTRANPELTLATTRERGGFADPYAQSLTVGVRIPFGADSRQRARMVLAEAEAVEAETQLQLDREQVLTALDTARLRLAASQTQLAAAERRATLAAESRAFFDKSFRFGESDLPTRLRVEFEFYEADRQQARSRIALAEAISQLRQALGLLPE